MQSEVQENRSYEKVIAKEPGQVLWWLLFFMPMTHYLFYKNWRRLGEDGKAWYQFFLMILGVIVLADDPDVIEISFYVYVAFTVISSLLTYSSMTKYLNDRLMNRYAVVSSVKWWQYISFAVAYLVFVLLAIVAYEHKAEKEQEKVAKVAVNTEVDVSEEEKSKAKIFRDIGGVWAFAMTNQAIEINFEYGQKWIVLSGEKLWVKVKHVDLENEYVVFFEEGKDDLLHTIRVYRKKDGSHSIAIALAGEGLQPLNWVRENVPN